MNPYIQNNKHVFAKAIDHFKAELSHLRTGQANPELLDGLTVMAYETATPIKQLASITAPEPKLLLVQPWDKGLLKDIEKAILAANMGFAPVNDGEVIRIPMPPMTEENRKDLVKIVNAKAEEARIAIRHAREQIKELINTAETEKEISEDSKYTFLKQLDAYTTENNNLIKTMVDEKSTKIMTI